MFFISSTVVILSSLRPTSAHDGGAASVSTIASELGQELGTEIQVASGLGSLLVLMDGRAESPEIELRGLASALHASIRKSGAGYVLERTTDDSRTYNQWRTLERTKWIQQRLFAIDQFRQSSFAAGSPDRSIRTALNHFVQVSADITAGRRLSPDPYFPTDLLPAEQLLRSAILAVGLDKIAGISSDESRVWEDKPTGHAAQLPDLSAPLQKYESEVSLLQLSPLNDRITGTASKASLKPFFADWSESWKPPTKLRLQARSEDSQIIVSLTGYNDQGGLATFATLIARADGVWRPPSVITFQPMRARDSRWVNLDSTMLAAASGARDAISADPPAWFTHPEEHEPLDLLAVPALRSLESTSPNKLHVFVLSDFIWDAARLSVDNGRLNIDAFRALLEAWSSYERSESDSSIIWRPKWHLVTPDDCVSRKALGQFARRAFRTHRLELGNLAELHTYTRQPTSLMHYWITTFQSSSVFPSVQGSASHRFYQLIAKLVSTNESEGSTLPPTYCSDLGAEAAVDALFDEDIIRVRGSHGLGELFQHPWESLTPGELGAVRISLQTQTLEKFGLIEPKTGQQPEWSTRVPALGALARIDSTQGEKHYSMSREQYEQWLDQFQFQLANQGQVTLLLALPSGLTYEDVFTEPLVPKSARLSYNQLPTEIREQMWTAACNEADQESQHAKSSSPSQGSIGNAPPP